MSKTIEEEIWTYAQMCSFDEAGYIAIEKAVQFGIDLHTSLPLSQRLTDEEREKIKANYADAKDIHARCVGTMRKNYIADLHNEYTKGLNIGIMIALKHIFGKEMFEKE